MIIIQTKKNADTGFGNADNDRDFLREHIINVIENFLFRDLGTIKNTEGICVAQRFNVFNLFLYSVSFFGVKKRNKLMPNFSEEIQT